MIADTFHLKTKKCIIMSEFTPNQYYIAIKADLNYDYLCGDGIVRDALYVVTNQHYFPSYNTALATATQHGYTVVKDLEDL